MIELLYVGFWTLTYVLIIIAGFQSRQTKRVSMPYTAGVLNLAWEICAVLINPSIWGYYPWLILDIVIAFLGYKFKKSQKERHLYLMTILLGTVCLYLLCCLSQLVLIISVYVIDLIMAVVYLHQRQKLSPKLKLMIGITRFLGDLFAGIEALFLSWDIISVIVIAVFVCNIIYLVMTVIEKRKANMIDPALRQISVSID